MEAVKTYRLILDTGYHLDLMDTFYVPSITRNLIFFCLSLMLLDTLLSLGMVVSVCLSLLL